MVGVAGGSFNSGCVADAFAKGGSVNARKLISIVCPFYNEGPGVTAFYEAMAAEMALLSEYDFEVVCVDDGSKDDTLTRLTALSDSDARFN